MVQLVNFLVVLGRCDRILLSMRSVGMCFAFLDGTVKGNTSGDTVECQLVPPASPSLHSKILVDNEGQSERTNSFGKL